MCVSACMCNVLIEDLHAPIFFPVLSLLSAWLLYCDLIASDALN